MKKISVIMLFFAVALIISSCEKNFDPKIYGLLSTTNFPKTEADYEALVMDCYVPFTTTWGYTWSGDYEYNFYIFQGVLRLFDMTADYEAPRPGSSGTPRMSQANFTDFKLVGSSAGDDTPLFNKVRNITRFTSIIDAVGKATVLSDAKKKSFLGEARLCRGLVMYYLLHTYGPVPVIIDPALVGSLDGEQNLVRPTLAEMTQFITDDFEFAAANMDETVTTPGRYTADYARFCLMRHCLNEGSYMDGYYDRAIEMYTALKSHNYQLFTTGVNPYVDLFKNANKFNSEIIMSVSNGSGNGDGSSGNFNPIEWYCIPSDAAKYSDVANTIPTPFVNQGGGWIQWINVSPAYYDTYESGDLRKGVVFSSYVVNDVSRTVVTRSDIGVKWYGFIINKYPIETTDPFQKTDMPLARWADVLLMYAEAVARKNNSVPTGEALQGVNDVRARAGLAPLSGTAISSYTGFMDALLAERGHEFLYEQGCRKIDLIRFNKYRHNNLIIKGIAPTSQYMPLPDYVINQATAAGKHLEQTFERPDYASDN